MISVGAHPFDSGFVWNPIRRRCGSAKPSTFDISLPFVDPTNKATSMKIRPILFSAPTASSRGKLKRSFAGFATDRRKLAVDGQRYQSLYAPIKEARRAWQRFVWKCKRSVPSQFPVLNHRLRSAFRFQEAEQFELKTFHCHGALQRIDGQSMCLTRRRLQGGGTALLRPLPLTRLHFSLEIMLVCVRWCAAYPLRLRNLEEMMAERGVLVDHTAGH